MHGYLLILPTFLFCLPQIYHFCLPQISQIYTDFFVASNGLSHLVSLEKTPIGVKIREIRENCGKNHT